MITITRSLARQVRAVFRRALNASTRRPSPAVCFSSGPDGLSVQAVRSPVAVEYHAAGDYPLESIVVPLEALAQCAGRSDDVVTLERHDEGAIIRWTDEGVPQLVQCDLLEAGTLPRFPTSQSAVADNPPSLLAALEDAVATTDPDAGRYALNHVQLRGEKGEIVSTDGRQLLIQRGFSFPWNDGLLILGSPVFGCKELAQGSSLKVAQSEDWIGFRIGPWTIFLLGESDGRFPEVDDHIRPAEDSVSRLEIGAVDAPFLVKSLRRLPMRDKTTQSVTVDLNGQVAIRAQSECQAAPTELVLVNSTYRGDAMRINTNRTILGRAVAMGFREFYLFGPESPVLCRDDHRSFVWATLDAQSAIKPHADAIRIESSAKKPQSNSHTTRIRRKRTPMTTNHSTDSVSSPGNGSAASSSTTPDVPSVDDLIVRADALKAALRESAAATSELISGLKRHRRKSKLVQNTLASLRQLQRFEV